MATGKLIGSGISGTGNDAAAGYIHCVQFTCSATGIISEIQAYVLLGCSVRLAIYSDNGSDLPGNLLNESASTAITATGWRSVSIPDTNVTAGTKYWLAGQWSVNGGIAYRFTTIKRGYKSYTYGPFPSTITGASYDTILEYCLAGFGVLVLSPSTLPSAETVGQPKLNFSLNPSTIASQETVGSPTIQLAGNIIQPVTITSAEVVGSPTLIKLLQFLAPVTIPSAEVVGQPSLKYRQIIVSTTIPSAEVVGIPSIGVFGIIVPVTIPSAETVGGPILLKYVWHVILDALYSTETPDINRAFIIGRDVYGNPVYGEAHDTMESALVGQRLDFRQELAIPTTTQAGSMASAVLSKMRLTGKMAVILIPPNCGQELFDVVQVTDKGANQSAQAFRVVGIRFEYNPRQARYHHKLILGAS